MFKDLAIVIHTMDKYDFCWDGWYETFKRHWNFDLGIDIYFANEVRNVNFDGIIQLKTDIGEWSDRLNRAFNMIPHKYILYWQEDMWMLSNLGDFTEYYNDFVKYDMDHLMLLSEMSRRKDSWLKYHNDLYYDKYLKANIEETPFVIFHQPSIWKKEFLLKYLQHNENPWDNEIEGTKRAKEDHKVKEINSFNVNKLKRWYVPISHRGKLESNAEEVRNGTYLV